MDSAPRIFLKYFHALRQLLLQFEATICSTAVASTENNYCDFILHGVDMLHT